MIFREERSIKERSNLHPLVQVFVRAGLRQVWIHLVACAGLELPPSHSDSSEILANRLFVTPELIAQSPDRGVIEQGACPE